jgi:NAD(P)-dependent dehydrogenase (short-subunit alcohol dehydrogenase family)
MILVEFTISAADTMVRGSTQALCPRSQDGGVKPSKWLCLGRSKEKRNMPDKVALVTGAARGIGLATTKLFIAQGWRVAMADRDGDELSKAAKGLNEASAFVHDVSDPADVDGMVNAALVNIASISGLRASTLRVAYGTSKAAVIQLTKQQAAELGEYGIRANCVCPGPVRTKLAMAVHTQDIIDAYHDAIPLNRYGSEDEIAEVITFLCSDKASYVTGQVIASDGGFESTGVGLPSLRS